MIKFPKIVTYQSTEDDQWYWKLVGGNGERQAHGEAHPTEYNAYRAAITARRNMWIARIIRHLT